MHDAVIFDIDSTLSDPTHRLHHVLNLPEGKRKDYDAFNAELSNDLPKQEIINICNYYAQRPDMKVILLTGRSEKWRAQTEAWLKKYNIQYHSLIMRPDRDFCPAVSYKMRELLEIQKQYNVVLAVDDDPDIIKAFVEAGVLSLQVALTSWVG